MARKALPISCFPPFLIPNTFYRFSIPFQESVLSNLRTQHDAGAFVPGELVAERYRIVARIGRGGMGEVYRADDMRLGQSVALKFLPPELESDEAARERLLAEVRLARAVAHPNVCRVYDIGDLPATDRMPARTFLTMEYIDGEDLGSLLRRIGRLPPAKALDIARQLCAGLAAAHAKSVLHRDLKPANVMIDGRGQARIADFGIAIETAREGDTNSADRSSGNAGTLAYMAPELFMGEPASVRSDIYALGLVLYETFTGESAYKVSGPHEWVRAHATSQPSDPSAHVTDMDPIASRAILKCLEKDPEKRPVSAAQVAAMLPGGDPLAAALAAGETPSPELVAASGEEGTLSRGKAWGAYVMALLAVAIAAWLTARSLLINKIDMPLNTKALEYRARETMASLGYTATPRDWVGAWWDGTTSDSVHKSIGFRYRQSPEPLFDNFMAPALLSKALYGDDVNLLMDQLGHVRRLDVGGTKDYTDTTSARSVDWAPLLAAIGAETPPVPSATRRWPPAFYADTRAAWTAVIDGKPSEIEAAALRGRVVSLRIRAIGADDEFAAPERSSAPGSAPFIVTFILVLAVTLGVMARRNVRMGRGDRRGATRLATVVLISMTLFNLFDRHWSTDLILVILGIMTCLLMPVFIAALIWCSYVAIEPYVRRRWPSLLVSWARLLDGRVRDGFVGQALLAGVTVGALSQAFLAGQTLLIGRETYFSNTAWWKATDVLGNIPSSIAAASLSVGLLVVFRMLFRRDWAAWSLFALAMLALQGDSLGGPPWMHWSFALVSIGMVVMVLYRFGYMALVITSLTVSSLSTAPFTLDASRWYFWTAAPALILAVGLATLGFMNVLGKQTLVHGDALDG